MVSRAIDTNTHARPEMLGAEMTCSTISQQALKDKDLR
jgi:hypothetical protein